MILDERNEFADAVSLSTTGTGTLNIGDQIYVPTAGLNLGTVDDIFCVIEVDTAIGSTGSATVEFRVCSDNTATIHATTSTKHYTSGAIAVASLVKGYRIAFALPRGTYEEYIGVQTVIGTAKLNAGKINAYLVNQPYDHTAYPRGD